MTPPDLLPRIWFDEEWKSVTQFYDYLAIGSFVHAPKLAELGWRCLIMTTKSDWPRVEIPPHMHLPIIDGTGNDPGTLKKALDWITGQWSKDRKTAVLCRSGFNRSPIASACAMKLAGRINNVVDKVKFLRTMRKAKDVPYNGLLAEFESALLELL